MEKKTPYETWTGRVSDLLALHSFGTTCYVKKEKTKKLEERAIKGSFLGYEATNQYRVWDVEDKSVIRAAHVEFDDFTVPSEIGGDSDDFEYATLDFFQPGEEDLTAPETADIPPTSDVGGVGEVVEVDTGETSETGESDHSESRDEGLARNFENLSIDQFSEQPASPAPAPASGRPSRNMPRPDYSKLNDPGYRPRGRGGQGRGAKKVIESPAQIDKARGFAARIRKTRISDAATYKIPTTWAEVLLHQEKDKWVKAAEEEYNHHVTNGTWVIETPPSGARVLGGRWVFDIKRGPDGEITRYKARWVAQGFRQVEGIDFFESYSGVVKSMRWKGILALCTRYDYEVHHVDIISAYLEAELKEEVWMQQPHGFESDDSTKACLLRKAIYGLKQSARMWYETLEEFLTGIGFVKILFDHSVFIHENGMIIAVYVDDLLLAGPELRAILDFKEKLGGRFRVKDLGKITFYLGVKIIRNRKNSQSI